MVVFTWFSSHSFLCDIASNLFAGVYLNPNSSYPAPIQSNITYTGSYVRPQVQMGVGLSTEEGTITYGSGTSAAAPTTLEAAVWRAYDPVPAPW